jgi:aspartyl-tRNA(Asn)/glutamyl-tRNA(Gln) amidotransferase subunit A
LREVQLSPLQDWAACGSLISITERAAAYEEWSRTRLRDFSERMASRLMLGAFVSGVDYVQAVRRRRELRAELQQVMRGLDVVLTATQPSEAAKIDAVPKWDLFDRPNFTMPFNVAGYPAISICSGFGPAGCRWQSSSSPSRLRSRPCSASPTPSRRRPHIEASARRSSPLALLDAPHR